MFQRTCLAALAAAAWSSTFPVAARRDVPARLSDAEFWALSESLSEPSGYFRSDNLVSDELIFDRVMPALARATRPGGTYLGVGPEQNFSYIAAIRPRMAFIVDIRRGNLHEHLLYKALFELSADRADFVSRLFTKPRPAGLTAQSTAKALMDAFWNTPTPTPTPTQPAYDANLLAVNDVLIKRHGFALSKEDLDGIAYVYHAFYWFGLRITWATSSRSQTTAIPNFADLMRQSGTSGEGLSFLASEERFRVVKDLQSRNAIVPMVGNFAGPKTLRAIGQYLRDHDASVDVFYIDEVEPYLRQDGIWADFCENVAAMPLNTSSVFIRPATKGFFNQPPAPAETGAPSLVTPIAPDVQNCRGR
jgi:hypothetical protein